MRLPAAGGRERERRRNSFSCHFPKLGGYSPRWANGACGHILVLPPWPGFFHRCALQAQGADVRLGGLGWTRGGRGFCLHGGLGWLAQDHIPTAPSLSSFSPHVTPKPHFLTARVGVWSGVSGTRYLPYHVNREYFTQEESEADGIPVVSVAWEAPALGALLCRDAPSTHSRWCASVYLLA